MLFPQTINGINDDMKNIEIVKKMYDLFAANKHDEIRNLFAPNIQWNQMKGFPGGGQYSGIEAVIQKVFGGFNSDWTNWKAHITRYVDTGTSVFVVGFYEGTYNTTQRYMKANFICEYEVKDNCITAFHQYTDTFLIGQAMGLTIE